MERDTQVGYILQLKAYKEGLLKYQTSKKANSYSSLLVTELYIDCMELKSDKDSVALHLLKF